MHGLSVGRSRAGPVRMIVLSVVITLIVLISLCDPVFVPTAMAASLSEEIPDPEVVSQPQELVKVIVGLTRSLGVGFVLSFILKNASFQALGSKTKWWIVISLSVGLPTVAQLLLDFVPPDIWDRLNPYWTALSWGFISWAGTQATWYKFVKPALAADAEAARASPAGESRQ